VLRLGHWPFERPQNVNAIFCLNEKLRLDGCRGQNKIDNTNLSTIRHWLGELGEEMADRVLEDKRAHNRTPHMLTGRGCVIGGDIFLRVLGHFIVVRGIQHTACKLQPSSLSLSLSLSLFL